MRLVIAVFLATALYGQTTVFRALHVSPQGNILDSSRQADLAAGPESQRDTDPGMPTPPRRMPIMPRKTSCFR